MSHAQRVFSGADTTVVFEQIKEELGEDAIIMNIIHLPEGGVEVSASVLDEPPKEPALSEEPVAPSLEHKVEVFTGPVQSSPPRRSSIPKAIDQVNELRLALGVQEEFAQALVRGWSLPANGLQAKVESVLRRAVPLCESVRFRGRFVCAVGPAGSGKTSTCFKLAHKLSQDCGIQAGVLHLDSAPPPALGELELTVVSCPLLSISPSALGRLLQEFSKCEIVFIDLPRFSVGESAEFREIERLVGLLGNVEFLFVADSCLQAGFLQRSVESLACFGLDKVAITKIDEGASLGPVLSTLQQAEIPLAFLANGCNIPSDIEPACYSRLAWLFARQLLQTGVVETLLGEDRGM